MSGGERRRQAPEPGASGGGSGVAVVLAGAGARGAYEAGSLSVILPALGASQPRLYVGTSAGAINAVGFAALSHLDPEEAGERALVLWRALRQRQVFHPPLATLVASTARRLMSGGRVRHRPVGLLDTAPLHRTLGRVLSWDQLHVNIRHGHVDACAVIATEKSSHSSAVFVQGGRAVPTPEADDVRGIRYLRSTLTPAHVVASSSLPALFPATAIEHSGSGRDHYVDGGVRLNTPIKPALALGADRVVVVATSPASMPAVGGDAMGRPPGVGSGLVDVLRAVLDDRMVEDLRMLTRDNRKAARRVGLPATQGAPRCIEYVFAGPSESGQLGELARDVLRARRLCSPTAPLDRLLAGSPDLSELASYLMFDPDFIDGAIELGRRDARKQLRRGAVVWRTTGLAELARPPASPTSLPVRNGLPARPFAAEPTPRTPSGEPARSGRPGRR